MIRWITEKLGTAPAVSAAISGDIARLDVRDLVDKSGNTADVVRERIERGVALLAEGKRVVVCCDYGISRSNAVAAGIISLAEGTTLEQAVRTVTDATGEKEIKLAPLNAVRAALGQATQERPSGAHARVLVTGGSGFIGRHLQAALEDEVEFLHVAGGELDLTSGALALELLVREQGIDQIVHLANPRVYTSNRALGDTLSMLRNVLDVCRSSGTRLVFPSGWEVYSGYPAPELLADETLPLRPKGPYGETKMLCEQLLRHHQHLYGLDCCIVRASPVYGAGSDKPKFLYNFVRKAREGAPIRTHNYRNGLPKLDLMHVSDMSRLLTKVVVERPLDSLNVGGGNLYSTNEIAKLIVAHCRSKSKIECLDIDDYTANIMMDSKKACDVLNWHPLERFRDALPTLIDDQKDLL